MCGNIDIFTTVKCVTTVVEHFYPRLNQLNVSTMGNQIRFLYSQTNACFVTCSL